MTAITSEAPGVPRIRRASERNYLAALASLAFVLALQFTLVFNRAVNWDEFWHYSLTVQATRGLLDQPLQTFFTRAFMWVPAMPGSSIDHIVLIRTIMFACELVTLTCIAGIAARFTDRLTGLLCALTYLCAGYVLQHGTSFRFDPQAAALLMASLWVLTCRPASVRWFMLAGALGGLSAIITIKSVLYAPAFAGVFWLRWSESDNKPGFARNVAAMFFAAATTFAIAYAWHAADIVDAVGRSAKDTMSASADKMFSLVDHPYWRHNVKGALFSPVTTLLVMIVPVMLWRSELPKAERIALAGFWLPLTTLGFYHNTAPYFHVFMLAPVAVTTCAVIPALCKRYSVGFLIIGLLAGAAITFAKEERDTIKRQQQIVSTAERIFGSGVAYFDACAMLGKLHKANGFMTPWGTERYLRGQLPSLSEIQAKRAVPLVVNDDPMFEAALNTSAPVASFRPDDLAMLRKTYVHFWGPFWIAGFAFEGSAATQDFLVRVPGNYTVTGSDGAVIDGRKYAAGSIVELASGKHAIAAREGLVRLTWGRDLKAPEENPPQEPYFTNF
ncbi:MAG: hypothetical protein ACO1OX_07060 [Novosphingobium sp.]